MKFETRFKDLPPAVLKRRRMEYSIARRFILDAVKAGYTLRVHDGQEFVTTQTKNTQDLLAAMFSVDEEHIYVYKDGLRIGWVFFVYGNGGWDVIADNTINLEPIMEGVSEYADSLCLQYS